MVELFCTVPWEYNLALKLRPRPKSDRRETKVKINVISWQLEEPSVLE